MVVYGLVQGVFFRDTCRRLAEAGGVGGWVSNRPDGSVEAVFEGEPRAVERMVRWTREGPPYARVDAVDVTDEPPQGESTFRIR
ncbi:MAG: acylphosphatase [Propionibacteriales bacterium]|nr:acylphosphatase [Propionibacteriales bacterium]